MRNRKEEKIHSKVANCFYSKALKLVHHTNRRREKFKIITSSPFKKNTTGPRTDNQN